MGKHSSKIILTLILGFITINHCQSAAAASTDVALAPKLAAPLVPYDADVASSKLNPIILGDEHAAAVLTGGKASLILAFNKTTEEAYVALEMLNPDTREVTLEGAYFEGLQGIGVTKIADHWTFYAPLGNIVKDPREQVLAKIVRAQQAGTDVPPAYTVYRNFLVPISKAQEAWARIVPSQTSSLLSSLGTNFTTTSASFAAGVLGDAGVDIAFAVTSVLRTGAALKEIILDMERRHGACTVIVPITSARSPARLRAGWVPVMAPGIAAATPPGHPARSATAGFGGAGGSATKRA